MVRNIERAQKSTFNDFGVKLEVIPVKTNNCGDC